MKGRLRSVPDYKCKKCTYEIKPLEGLPAEYVVVSNESLEVVIKFFYLGDTINAGGDFEESIKAGRNIENFCLYLPPRCFTQDI